LKKLVLSIVLGLILVLIIAPAAFAGPPSQPNYGNWNPLGEELTPPEWGWDWEAIGVEKLKPPYFGEESTHIVTDPLTPYEGVDPLEVAGWVTFWCSSKVGAGG
jgi:hypothetical protein